MGIEIEESDWDWEFGLGLRIRIENCDWDWKLGLGIRNWGSELGMGFGDLVRKFGSRFCISSMNFFFRIKTKCSLS